MSSSLQDPLLQGLTPEEELAYHKAQGRGLSIAIPGAAASAITNLAPDPQLPGLLGYVPFAGGVERLLGLGKAASDLVAMPFDYALGKAGLSQRIPQAPQWMETAGQHAQATSEQLYGQLGGPQVDPNSEEAILKSASEGVGALAPAGPASAMPGFAKWLIPTTHGAPINMPLGGALGMAGESINQVLNEPATTAPVTPTQPQAPTQVAANEQPNVATDAPTGFAKLLQQPQPQPQAQPQQAPTSFASYLQQGAETPPGPTFDELGTGEHTVAQGLLTFGGILAAVAAAAFTHRIGGAATQLERTQRFNDPVYAAKAQEYNDSVIKRGGADISDPNAPEPPLPEANRFRQATNYANTKILDSNAQMMDAIRMVAEPNSAERMAHTFGMAHTNAAFDVRLDNFIKTGLDPISGVKIEPPIRLFQKVGSLDEDRLRTLNDGLNAANEQNNRAINAREFRTKNPGVTPTTADIAHDFWNQDNAQLGMIINKMHSDPVLSSIANDFYNLGNGLIDIGERRSFFTAAEAQRLKADHPNYVPEVGPDKRILHPFGPRDKGTFTGVEQVNSMAHANMAQHLQELYKSFDHNDSNRMLWNMMQQANRQMPGSAKFMYEVPGPGNTPAYASGTGGQARERIVTIRTAGGPKYVRVDHTDFYNAMTGNSLLRNRIMQDIIGLPRRLYTRGTTGVAAALGGKVYAVVNPIYAGFTMPVNAPKNMYGGILDRAVQRSTGRTTSLARGLDMVSWPPGVAYSYGRGVGDRWVNRLADWFEPSARNPLNKELRAYLGDATVDNMHQSMKQFYLNTVTNKMRDMGIGGLGQPIKTDLPATVVGGKTARLMAAKLAPDAFFAGKWMGTKPFFIKLNNILQEAFTNLGDAGNEYFARLNWDNPNVNKQTLAYETRALTGDPGTSGSSTGMQLLNAAVPYTNIAMQGIARVGRSIGERPFQAPMTAAIGLGTIALASILTHMRSKEHLEYLQNQLSLQQREGNIVLATSDDPHASTIIPIPQEFRLAYAVMLDLVSKAVNIVAMQHDPVTFDGVLKMMKDFFGSHITNSTRDAAIHGAVDAFGVVNLPPYAGQFDYNKLAHGNGLFESYNAPFTSNDPRLPNQVSDGVLDDKDGKIWQGILKTIFGAVGSTFGDINNITRYAKQTGSWSQALGMGGHDWLEHLGDKNPQGNILFEHALRLSTQPPIVEQVQRSLNAIDKVQGSRTAEISEGYTGRGRSPQAVPVSTEKALPADPTMRQLYNMTDAYKSRLAPLREEVANIRKQMGAVQQQGMNPVARREWMNDRTRDLADKHRFIASVVADLDHMMSNVVGAPVRVESIDWKKGPEQFR